MLNNVKILIQTILIKKFFKKSVLFDLLNVFIYRKQK